MTQATVTRLPTAVQRSIRQPANPWEVAEAQGLTRLSEERRKRQPKPDPLTASGAVALAMGALIIATAPSRKEAKVCKRNTAAAVDRLKDANVAGRPDTASAVTVLASRCSQCGWCKVYGLSAPAVEARS
jgi:hypothetical protein